MRSKSLLGSSREVEQGCGVSFVNYLYLVPLIIGQNFCATSTTNNQTGPNLESYSSPDVDMGFSDGFEGDLREPCLLRSEHVGVTSAVTVVPAVLILRFGRSLEGPGKS